MCAGSKSVRGPSQFEAVECAGQWMTKDQSTAVRGTFLSISDFRFFPQLNPIVGVLGYCSLYTQD